MLHVVLVSFTLMQHTQNTSYTVYFLPCVSRCACLLKASRGARGQLLGSWLLAFTCLVFKAMSFVSALDCMLYPGQVPTGLERFSPQPAVSP